METNLAYKFEEERREEIINGRVVMMSAPTLRHILIAGKLYHMFSSYLEGKFCTAIPDGAALFLEEGAEEYQPDMMVVCDRDKLKQRKGVYGAPDLVVEVLSPSTGRDDRGHKKDVYEKHGVREYWIINPRDESIEQYVLENGRFVLRNLYTRYTEEMLEDLTDEEKAALVTEFHPALFEDFNIRLDDVFDVPGA